MASQIFRRSTTNISIPSFQSFQSTVIFFRTIVNDLHAMERDRITIISEGPLTFKVKTDGKLPIIEVGGATLECCMKIIPR